MITWLRKFLGLCVHNYEVYEVSRFRDPRTNAVVGTQYDLRCKNCGVFKFQRSLTPKRYEV